MAATKQQIDMFRSLVNQGFDRERAKSIVMKVQGEQPTQDAPEQKTDIPEAIQPFVPEDATGQIEVTETTTDEPGVFGRIGEKLSERGARVKSNIKQQFIPEPDDSLLEIMGTDARETFQNIGEFFGGAFDIAGELVGEGLSIAGEAVPEGVKDFTKEKAQDLLESDTAQLGLKALKAGAEAYAKFSENNPETAATINAAANIFSAGSAGQVGKKVTGGIGDADLKKAEDLAKSAEGQVAEFLQPSKDVTTRAAKKITPEILERDIKGSREEVLSLAKDQRQVYGKMIEDFETIGLDGEINMNEIDNVIDKFVKNANLVDTEGNIIAGQAARVKALDEVMQTLRTVSAGSEVVDPNKFRVIRKAFDEVYSGTDASLDQFSNALKKEVADELRKQFARDNPLMADINKEFSFYANLDNVLSENIDRRFGKGEGGGLETKKTGQITTATAGVGGALGFALGGPQGAVIGALVGRQTGFAIDKLISSPKWKLASAQKKQKLADAIASGDGQKMKTAINGIITSLQLNPNDFKYEEIQTGDEFIEEQGGFLETIKSLR